MNSPFLVVIYRDCAHSREHSVDYEQSLQERLSHVVCSYLHRAAPPRKNSAPYLVLPIYIGAFLGPPVAILRASFARGHQASAASHE
jgi:hypothetical protein